MTSLIFVIEDESAFIDVYDKLFEIMNAKTVDWAFSGEEAIEKFKKAGERPDLIIMDQRLPKMNGVDTMVEIHKMDPTVKVIFVSADGRIKKAAMDKGAVDFIQKPFSIDEFVRVIKAHI